MRHNVMPTPLQSNAGRVSLTCLLERSDDLQVLSGSVSRLFHRTCNSCPRLSVDPEPRTTMAF